ncbi:MFS transporter [Streptomyces sp. NPDC127584]|uniref:MFS transporter n=1 Tax=Streptomyces sp. NPDC127584 TaxID=3345403 RepID=UPI00363E037C
MIKKSVKKLVGDYALPGRNHRIIAVGVVVNASGSGFYLTGSTLYFLKGIGLTVAQVGLGLTIAGLVGFLTTVPVTLLAKRLGPLTLLRSLQLWRAAWLVALAFSEGMATFTLCASMVMVSQGPIFPMVQILVNTTAGSADRTRMLGVISSVINVGMSIGTLAAAPLISMGGLSWLRSVILAGAACSVLSSLVFRLLDVDTSAAEPTAQKWYAGLVDVAKDRPYLALSTVNGILFLHPVLLGVAIPLWLVEATNAPEALLSVLLFLNTVLAIVFQVHFAKNIRSTADGTRSLLRSGLTLGLFSLVLIPTLYTDVWLSIAILVVATILLTCGELFQGAGAWELSIRHAPESKRAEYLAVFSLGGSIANIVGPALVAVLITWGASGMVVLASLFAVAAGLITAVGGRLARSESTETVPGASAAGAPSAGPPSVEPAP